MCEVIRDTVCALRYCDILVKPRPVDIGQVVQTTASYPHLVGNRDFTSHGYTMTRTVMGLISHLKPHGFIVTQGVIAHMASTWIHYDTAASVTSTCSELE